MIVTKDWIKKYRSKNGGYTKKQLNAVGIEWPPRKGWINEVVGKEIADDEKIIFEKG